MTAAAMVIGAGEGDAAARRRRLARERSEAYRARKRRGAVLVAIELEPRDLAALERLALLAPGDRDPHRMARAAARFIAAAPHVAAMRCGPRRGRSATGDGVDFQRGGNGEFA